MKKFAELNWEKIEVKLAPYQTRPSGSGKSFKSLRLAKDTTNNDRKTKKSI